MNQILVLLHVLAGSLALIGLIGGLVTKKGGLWHRRLGKLYTLAMAITLFFALVVAIVTANYFLLLIGLFSGYFVYTGWRLAVARKGDRLLLDQWLTQLMLITGAAMVIYGVYLTVTGASLGVALAVFGIFALQPAWQDFKFGNKWPDGKKRIVLHIGRMGGAGIATVTAVFVVNVKTNPAFVAWLVPTLIGTPLILYFSKRFGPDTKAGTRT